MNSTPQSQNSPPIGTNPFVRYYEEWSERTPLVTKYSVIGLIVSYMISLFLYFFGINFDDFFTNEVEYTVYRFEIYRLILSPFVGNNIIMVIFIIIFFVLTSSKFENSQGSLRFLFLMGTLTLLTNISFILISLICYLSGVESAYEWVCAGFWNVCFPLITMECMLVSFLF
jgi:membrane associated rhomboid family serine protease